MGKRKTKKSGRNSARKPIATVADAEALITSEIRSQCFVDRQDVGSFIWAVGDHAPTWAALRPIAIGSGTQERIIPKEAPPAAIGAGLFVSPSGPRLYPFSIMEPTAVELEDDEQIEPVFMVPQTYPEHVQRAFGLTAPPVGKLSGTEQSVHAIQVNANRARKGIAAMLKIFHENGEVVIQTDARDEKEFVEAWAAALSEMIVEMHFNSQEEWENFLREVSTQYGHMVCHFRGYKSPQVEVRQIATSGSRYLMDKTTPIVSTGQQHVHVGVVEEE